jgi:hypothetical protein
MSNPNVVRACLAFLFALSLAAAWPAATHAEEADQPEAGTAEPSDEKASTEGFAPDEEAAAPTADARSRNQAMCARLDDLMAKSLSPAERGKATETRGALHCPPPSRATQAAENPLPPKR